MDKTEFERSLDDKRPVYQYKVLTAADALQEQEPVNWFIDGLIPEGTLSVFYGKAGSKKTWALIHLAVCVARGDRWLGKETKQGRVLLIDEETGEYWTRERLKKAILGAFGDASTPISFVSLAGLMMDDRYDTEELERLILELDAKLVIIDALSEIMSGNENAKEDTLPVFKNLRRIAEKTGAAIIVIHHSNRAGSYRGSSAIPGAVDLMIKVISDGESEFVTFETEKERHVERVKFTAVAKWTEDQFYMVEADNVRNKKMSKSERYVIRYLKENGESEMQAIMNSADSTSENGAKQAVYSLVDKGILQRTNPQEKGRGVGARYDFVEGWEDGE